MSETVAREACSINELSNRTDTVFEAVTEATRLVGGFTYAYNGWGVLSDPSMTRSRLADIRAQIDKAIGVIDTTAWPQSDDDWDKLERQHNGGADA